MNRPEGSAEAVYIQTKHIAGQQDAADHGACHREKHEQRQHRPEYTDRRIVPPKKAPAPFEIQDMVQDKQQENADAKPFVRRLAYKRIRHQQK